MEQDQLQIPDTIRTRLLFLLQPPAFFFFLFEESFIKDRGKLFSAIQWFPRISISSFARDSLCFACVNSAKLWLWSLILRRLGSHISESGRKIERIAILSFAGGCFFLVCVFSLSLHWEIKAGREREISVLAGGNRRSSIQGGPHRGLFGRMLLLQNLLEMSWEWATYKCAGGAHLLCLIRWNQCACV